MCFDIKNKGNAASADRTKFTHRLFDGGGGKCSILVFLAGKSGMYIAVKKA